MNSKNKNHLNNKGFTLVEVLIAMVVLAIVVAPFLNSFVVSSRTNVKSKNTLMATTAAQNVLEGLKPFNMETIAYQFNYPENGDFRILDKNHISLEPGKVLSDYIKEYVKTSVINPEGEENITYEPVVLEEDSITSSILSRDNGIHYEFLGQGDGEYYFGIENLVVESRKYDILISADASAYRGDEDSEDFALNNQNIANIANLDSIQDAFYIQNLQLEDDVLQSWRSMNPGLTFTKDKVSREIQIHLSNVPTANGQVTKVTVIYTYGYEGTSITYEQTNTIYDNSEQQDIYLRGVYLFYTPLYDSTIASLKDKIIIYNEDNLDTTIYLVKQETGNLTELNTSEENYRVGVEVKETSLPSDIKAHLKIRTNLDYNLYGIYDTTGTIILNPAQAVYTYNTDMASQDQIKEKLSVDAITGTRITDNLYNMDIGVYEEGSASLGFPQEKRILSITGSIED